MATNPGQELATIDFASTIGGPLVAVINAQAQAAMSTVNFIKAVGFTDDGSEPIYVTFKYPKEISPYQPKVELQGDPAHPTGLKPGEDTNHPEGLPKYVAEKAEVPAKYEIHELSVPILTMLPIPYIRIEEVTLDFKAKIVSMEKTDTTTSLKADMSSKFKGGVTAKGMVDASVSYKTSMSYQRTTNTGEQVDKTYSMDIHIKAVQDEIPAGMERLLNILEEAIKAKPTGAITSG
jgi:Protein of unknown function (DUF2589)